MKQQLLLLRNLDVDFIVLRAWKVHETLPLFFFVRYILQRKKPYFILDLRTVPVDTRGTFKDRINDARFSSAIKLTLKFFDGLTVISEKLKQDIVKKYKCTENQVRVWTTAVDPNHFNPETAGNMRMALDIDNRFVVMYHGVFSPFRGLQQAIQAIAILKNRYPDILFVLLGKGEAQKEFEVLINTHDLQDHVMIHPPVSFKDLPSFVNAADCGILPFPDIEWWNTSGPIKLNEYLSMGKPVVLTDIAAHRAVIGDAHFGFYSKNEDPGNLAAAIEFVYKSQNRSKLSQEARWFAQRNLTWESQAKKIKSYFTEIDNSFVS
ncbi:MAG: glycosyltransferase family 4 protein [Desulfamplus sp.]|nr:glycosyltransferase family 4 protein [Desulfamplus sp.]